MEELLTAAGPAAAHELAALQLQRAQAAYVAAAAAGAGAAGIAGGGSAEAANEALCKALTGVSARYAQVCMFVCVGINLCCSVQFQGVFGLCLVPTYLALDAPPLSAPVF